MASVTVRLRSYAKVNLDLRVPFKRSDGYHEIQTVFQTISLADELVVTYEKSARFEAEIDSTVAIADNLVMRAARVFGEATGAKGRVHFGLRKRIPMGGGLGGGSSNAAAVLLALPVLTGKRVPMGELVRMAASLGSDVPFFLYGGTALGLGRGTELYPLPEVAGMAGLLVVPGVHVSTAEAYRALNRPERMLQTGLTGGTDVPILNSFGGVVWSMANGRPDWRECRNDFEGPVLGSHAELGAIKQRLLRLGPKLALMSGSGSSLFALFGTGAEAKAAKGRLADLSVETIKLMSRRAYRGAWWRALSGLAASGEWPPTKAAK